MTQSKLLNHLLYDSIGFSSGVLRGSRPRTRFGESPKRFCSSASPPQAASQKGKKRFFGDTQNPSKGRLPFAIPLEKRLQGIERLFKKFTLYHVLGLRDSVGE